MTGWAIDERVRPRLRIAGLALAVITAVAAPWWGPRALGELSYFRVRRVEIRGAALLRPSDVLARLAVDTTASVWDDVGPLERRVAAHPQVGAVRIERRLPGTLVVHVTENLPVALVATPRGFEAYDGAGRSLPVDPTATPVDVPVLAQRDTGLLRLLAEVRASYPALYDRISDVRRRGGRELLVRLASLRVRAPADVSAERLAELLPVEADLARRGARVAEVDLRYRDQVIARLQ
ncbi:MAG TPA: FtsQ-type POTRA domain-containing protein [Gemmatimonadaceae bacterium]|nr:FtsQ-type POTRA domain-containing protein [Gemmatimonadaceae bacterium]